MKCEFKNCVCSAKKTLFLGKIRNFYCEEHFKLLKRVFLENNIELLGSRAKYKRVVDNDEGYFIGEERFFC